MSLVATTMAVLSDIKGPSTLRRNHHAHCIGSSLPTSKMRLSYASTMMTNMNTIASYNLEDEDIVVLTVRKK